MKRPIDELCPLLEVKNTAEFTKEFGIANGTLSNLNNQVGSKIVKFLLKLSLESLAECSKRKRKKISRKMKSNQCDVMC